MTYSANEAAFIGGQPVELYAFRRGAQTWRYTSDADTVTHIGADWEPRYHERGAVEEGQEMNRSKLTVTVQRDHPIAWMFRIQAPSDIVTLTVYRKHRQDTDAVMIWTGRVLGVTWDENNRAAIDCEPVFTSLKRTGLRRLYQRTCPYALYDTHAGSCGVSRGDYAVTDSVTSIDGADVFIAAAGGYADGYFDGGYLVYFDPVQGYTESRMITSHVGTLVSLSAIVPDLLAGTSVTIYPGCDHSLATCDSKFDNALNFGGWPFIPGVNPFGGSQIF